tara:strand:- start:12103 stop:12603 length:501 start_codon:yes stop_codon:yes gene_type:complete
MKFVTKKRKELSIYRKVCNWLDWDVWNKLHYNVWRNPKRVVMNFWKFRKEIAEFRDFDYCYNFRLFHKSLEMTAHAIDNRELVESHIVKASSIKRYIELWERIEEDNYLEQAGRDWEKDNSLSDDKTIFKYTSEENAEFFRKAKIYKDNDFRKMLEAFKDYQRWWD